MSLPRYPEYKDSGVGWLEEVPAHWEVSTLRRVTVDKCDGPFGSGIKSEHYTNEGTLVVRLQNIRAGRFHYGEPVFLSQSYFESELRGHEVLPGDVLVAGLGDENNLLGRACVAPVGLGDALVKADCFRFRVEPRRVLSSFVAMQLSAGAHFDAGTLSGGTTRSRIPLSTMQTRRLVLPPLEEQAAIVAFLDREIAKIDALVAEQEKLQTLLVEKRQATISHAVTKGLNPDAPMRNSGVEWLGEVPAHWTVSAVGFRYGIQLGKMLDSAKITGEHLFPYLRVFDVQWGKINTYDLPTMDFDEEARNKFRLLPGDLLVNEGGSYPGRSAIWRGDLDECFYQKALHRVRSHHPDRDFSLFLFYVMRWAADHGVFVAGGNETTIEHLPAEKLRRYRFAFPPMSEQAEIVSFLDAETARLDALTAEATRAIALLKERRTALISAAVTGKIDARNSLPPQEACHA